MAGLEPSVRAEDVPLAAIQALAGVLESTGLESTGLESTGLESTGLESELESDQG